MSELDSFVNPDDPSAGNEVVWMESRRTNRTYLSQSFLIDRPTSRDYGQPARFIHKVFNTPSNAGSTTDAEEFIIVRSPGGRVQVTLLVSREAGQVKDLWIQRAPTSGDPTKLETLLRLNRAGAARLIELIKNLDSLPVEGENTVRIDDSLLREILSDPNTIASVYRRNRGRFRELISQDESARDLVALAYRREQIERFRELLTNPASFAVARNAAGSPEKVWQVFLETNPWILGVSLAGQLLTSWNDAKLEQVVTGFSIKGPGKRTDALMRTTGSIRSMVFAEIKHHMTDLLESETYRSGCWSPSHELSGGVVQIQQTVYRATTEIGQRLEELDDDSTETGESTYLHRPRSYLILGNLSQLRGASGGVNPDKQRSFEIFRRNLYEPEIITFDELLARAEWHVTIAEQEHDLG